MRRVGRRVVEATGLRAVHRLGASSKRTVPLATRIEFHRSLYRFHERRLGRLGAAAIRLLRLVRNILAVIALRRGRTAAIRITAFVAALAVFAYAWGVAVAASPASWLKVLTS